MIERVSSADCDGIFNIYKYDPTARRFWQITNVIGGAQAPWITPEGNLLYVHYTSFGWKAYGLAKDAFMNAPADGLFSTDFDGAVVKAALETSEDLSTYAGQTSEYRVRKSLMAPGGAPLLRLENDGGANWGLQGGFYFFAGWGLAFFAVGQWGVAFALLAVAGGLRASAWRELDMNGT